MNKQNTILREFLVMSVPVMIRGGIQWLISTFELVLLGVISSTAIAAAGIATTLLTLILSVLRIPSVGAISIMSQAFAKNDSDTAHKQFKASVALSAAGGVVFAVLIWFSGRWMASFFSEDASLYAAVGDYLKGFAIGLPAWALMPLVQAGMVTAGNAKQSMYAAIGSAVVFGILAVACGTGITDAIGFPLGLQVIGWITSISNWAYVILAFWWMNTKGARLRLDQFVQAPLTRQDTLSILRTGVPGSIENIVTSVGLNFLLKGLSLSGPAVMHVASVGLRMLELVWLPFWYLSGAVTRFLAGKLNTGSYQLASSALRQVMLIIFLPMLLVSLLYLAAPEFMLHVVGRDTSSLEGQQRTVFILTGVYQSVTVMIMSLSAGLRGFTLYTYPMKVQLLVTLLISLPFLFFAQGRVEPSLLIAFFVIVGTAQMAILYRRGSDYLKTTLQGGSDRAAAYLPKKRKEFKS